VTKALIRLAPSEHPKVCSYCLGPAAYADPEPGYGYICDRCVIDGGVTDEEWKARVAKVMALLNCHEPDAVKQSDAVKQ
jgi:hypothetical protein